MGLPFDIIHEILTKLPVKTLIRFKCVCQSWYCLISHPSFQQDHYFHCSQKDPLFLSTRSEVNEVSGTTKLIFSTYNNHGALVKEFSKTVQQPHHSYPLGSGLGLVFHGPDDLSICDQPILLCNPSTEEVITLPQQTKGLLNLFGLGYAASTKEFKVVIFITPHGLTESFCEIFTLGTCEWRRASCPPPQYKITHLQAPFVHRSLHFLPPQNEGDGYISVFNIESEEYTKIPLPEYNYGVAAAHRYLKEFRGSLCLVLYFKARMELCQLNDYDNGEWLKEYIIDFASLNSVFFSAPLAVMSDRSLLVRTAQDGHIYLISYNPRDKTFTQEREEILWKVFYVESFFGMSERMHCLNLANEYCF